MRPLLVTGWTLDGGAARAAVRLHAALRGLGVPAEFWSPAQDPGAPPGALSRARWWWFKVRGQLDSIPVRLAHRRRPGRRPGPAFTTLSLPARWPARLGRNGRPQAFDLAHLHFLGKGDLRLEQLPQLAVPLVWTMHDMWLITGGCHYAAGCTRHRTGCGACPILASGHPADLSARTFTRKRRLLGQLDLTVIAPSHWLADIARQSPLLEGVGIHVIPNCVDSDFWHPHDRAAARQTLGLPEHELIVLAGGFALGRDARKGGKFLPEVLAAAQRRLPGRALRLVVVGAHTLDPAQFAPLPLTSAGHLADDARLRLYYAAADAFVLPSLEDNLPNMVLEAAACGVPTAAFSAGGVADLIDPGQTGVLAPPADPQALGERLAWMACDAQRLAQLGQAARRRAQSLFAPAVIAARHAALYAHALDLSARSQ